MTQEEAFYSLASSTKEYLGKGELLDALHTLQSMTAIHETATHRQSVEDILSDYQRMLDFLSQGGTDPLRKQQYMRLMQRATILLQELRRDFRLQHTDDLYVRTLQQLSKSNEQYNTPQYTEDTTQEVEKQINNAQQTQTEDELFDYLWTSGQMTHEQAQKYSDQRVMPESLLQHVLSALTLSLLEYFDPEKLHLLMLHSHSQNTNTRAKALLGLCTSCELHSSLIACYPQLVSEIQDICNKYVQEIALIQHFICINIESERIQQEIQQEIIPHIIRAHKSDIKQIESNTENGLTLSLNDPTLSKELRKQIENSFAKMANLMRDGMDLNIGTFQALKRFPFFQRLSHWLLPFSTSYLRSEHSDFINELNLCDSDKYSLTLFLNAAPEAQVEQMKEQLSRQSQAHLAQKQSKHTTIHQAIRNAIQGLTRTLRHSRWAGQWPEVLGKKSLFVNTPIIGPVLSRSSHYLKRSIATYYNYEYYDYAAKLIYIQQQLIGETAKSYTRMAICEMNTNNISLAIKHLCRARTIDPQDKQVLYYLQSAYGRTKAWEKQAEILSVLEEMLPLDDDILSKMGYCLMKQERWKEAQQRFYKMEFNNQRVVASMRAIAWCSLKMGNFSSALRYYERLLSHSNTAQWEDLLNKAHTLWLTGNQAEALKFYKQYAKQYLLSNPQATDALKPFQKDRNILRQGGIDNTDIQLMHDLIIQSL